jgi:hypothetical protein
MTSMEGMAVRVRANPDTISAFAHREFVNVFGEAFGNFASELRIPWSPPNISDTSFPGAGVSSSWNLGSDVTPTNPQDTFAQLRSQAGLSDFPHSPVEYSSATTNPHVEGNAYSGGNLHLEGLSSFELTAQSYFGPPLELIHPPEWTLRQNLSHWSQTLSQQGEVFSSQTTYEPQPHSGAPYHSNNNVLPLIDPLPGPSSHSANAGNVNASSSEIIVCVSIT